MFLSTSSSLPLLPPPFTSILTTQYQSSQSSSHDHSTTNQPSQRRSNPHQPPAFSLRNPNFLHSILLDEANITSRKAAISTYGYSWLRPAGVAKTMLGRREEEAEREELERQMREQEEMELELERGEELARQTRLREIQHGQATGGGEEVEQRDLDDEIPDAEMVRQQQQQQEAAGGVDLDDEIPDADAENSFGYDEEDDDDDIEGETGITDEVHHTNLTEDIPTPYYVPTTAITSRTTPPQYQPPFSNPNPLAQQPSHSALPQNMQTLSEQPPTTLNHAASIPHPATANETLNTRDLDDDVPEPDSEWQHTDTELELEELEEEEEEENNTNGVMLLDDDDNNNNNNNNNNNDDDDQSMDLSLIIEPTQRSISGNAVAGNAAVTATAAAAAAAAAPSSSPQHPPAAAAATGSRPWLNRRSLSGIAAPPRTTRGNLFSGVMGRVASSGSERGSGSRDDGAVRSGGSGAVRMGGSPGFLRGVGLSTGGEEQQQQQQEQEQPRRSGRQAWVGREENRGGRERERESLD